jgi:transposase
MPQGMRWVGLDVHAHASAVAVFDDVTGEVITRRVNGRPIEVLDVLRELGRPVRAVYEAGPTGYGLVRRARAEGIEMAVCSPGNIERRPGDRIKTDKRDAIRLARLFAAGDLRLVWIPSEEQEQLRDLVRCREDLRADLMRARHRLQTFLLRRERYFPGPGGRWTLKHRHWLSQQQFDDPASRITYADYLHAHDVLLARRDRVGRELEQLAGDCVWGETIARLCCLRGINTLTALGLCAEIGDWRRFDHPDSIASYVGLVPSEHSSGQTRRLGKITKAGSTHARRLLVEAALHYRLTPAVGGKLAVRQRGQDPALIDHAWRVQRRLNARWNLLRTGRGKPAGIVTIAIARELVGACWEIATAP